MAERTVGLDIGTSAIRAVELTVGDGVAPVLEAYGQVGLPPGTVVDGEIRDRMQVVAALERLWREGGFSERQVHLGVAGLRAITREVDMPPLPPDELDDAVRFQAHDVVPFPIEETAMSAKVIAQYHDADGSPQIRVLVAAAHRDLVDGVVGAVEDAGLQPIGIDLDTAALARALRDDGAVGLTEAIVSVGAGLTMVVVHQNGLLQFVRTVDLGGDSVTRAIAGALDLPMADAEGLKRHLGAPGEHDSRAVSATEGAIGDLVGEIQNSLRFYASQPGRSTPARLLVTGAGAKVTGFMERLQQGVEMPVLEASPLARVDTHRLPITPEQAAAIDPTLAVPVGLAMPEPTGKAFNLLPGEVTARYAERRLRRTLMLVAAVIVLILVAASLWKVFSVRHEQQQIATLASQLQYINNVEVPKYDKAVALKAGVTKQQSELRPVVAGETDWLVLFNQIAQYIPPSAVLSSLQAQEGSSSSSGSTPAAPSSSAPSPTSVIATGSMNVTVPNYAGAVSFGQSMNQSPALSDVSLSGGLTPGTNNLSFGVVFSVDGRAHSPRLHLFSQRIP
jgi:type IV pilus assembly protein PilM